MNRTGSSKLLYWVYENYPNNKAVGHVQDCSQSQPWLGRGAANGVFSTGYVETKGLKVAPQVGLEPTTLRLTAEGFIAASRCKHKT